MSTIELLVLVLAVVLAVAWHLSYTASRLHRLHTRVEGTLAALDAQLVRRAEAALEVANAGVLDPAGSLVVAGAAAACLDASPEGFDARDWTEEPLAARERLESDLSRALRAALDDRSDDAGEALAATADDEVPPTDGPDAAGDGGPADARDDDPPFRGDETGEVSADFLLARLDRSHKRVGLARRFHNDSVEDVRWLRRRGTVRWFRLAGHAHLPRPVEFDDRPLGVPGR